MVSLLPILDLIDTLWNVKAIGREWFDNNYDRFNRYIVECKA